MARADSTSTMEGLRGKLGRKAVFRRSYGETIVAVLPVKTTKINEAQIARRAKFSRAIQYGKQQMLREDTKALYASGVNNKKRSAYLVATSDFMKVPKVNAIDKTSYTGAIGQQIRIQASDDFKVTQVSVVIQNAAGQEIERGPATVSETFRDDWTYVTTAANPTPVGSKIIVSAIDVPGNIGNETVTV